MPNNNSLNIIKTYADGSILFARDLDNVTDSISSWSAKVVNDFNQIIKDVFGTSYVLDQDGLNNLSSPIRNSSTSISALSWIFTGSITLPSSFVIDQSTADYSIVFNNPTAARQITFRDPGASDFVVYENATQTLTNKTITSPTILSALTVDSTSSNSVVRIDSFTNFNPILRLSELDVTKWDIFNDNTNDFLRFQTGGGLNSLSIDPSVGEFYFNSVAGFSADLILQTNGTNVWDLKGEFLSGELRFLNASSVTTATLSQAGLFEIIGSGNTSFTVNSASNTNPSIYLDENNAHKWELYNDFTTDFLSINNSSAVNVLTLTQGGDLAIGNNTGGCEFKINAATNNDAYVVFQENYVDAGFFGYDVNNGAGLDDAFRFDNGVGGEVRISTISFCGIDINSSTSAGVNPLIHFRVASAASAEWTLLCDQWDSDRFKLQRMGSTVVTFETTGEMLLPNIDTPTANCASMDMFVNCRAGYADAGATGTTVGDFNIDNIADEPAPGLYTVVWDTNFASGNYIAIPNASNGAGYIAESLSYSTTHVTIQINTSGGVGVDSDFAIIACGVQ